MTQVQYLTFNLGSELFAIEILKVKEIIPFGNVTSIPLMQPFIKGVMNIRGSVIPIIDMNKRLELNTNMDSKKESIIIISLEYENESHDVGFIVSKVDKVFTKDTQELESIPIFGTKVKKIFIKNVAKVDDIFITILDIEKILDFDELSITTQTIEE
ncbi:MAG: chemotaxis protein CheW [Campylobacterota bacterium]|nr:chemotaxis protein CheW [Campylobacterota bacterium]